jgi:hypothetical protein
MIQLPIDNYPCMSFSVTTDVGVLQFRTYWDSLLSVWRMDIIGSDGTDLLDGIALTTGSNNLIAGTGIPLLDGCALFVVDTSGSGNRTFDGFGRTAFVFMTFPTDTPVLPY